MISNSDLGTGKDMTHAILYNLYLHGSSVTPTRLFVERCYVMLQYLTAGNTEATGSGRVPGNRVRS